MWHFKSKDGDFEVHGTRQELKEQLNIFTIEIDGSDVIANVWDDRHWAIICDEYGITGDDTKQEQ